MEEFSDLQANAHWRMAVWALRVGYVGLAVVFSGLLMLLAGSTPWILAAGMFIWLPAAILSATGFMWARHELPPPRPGFWPIRQMLLHDSVHARMQAPSP